jgi:hypothetical protein
MSDRDRSDDDDVIEAGIFTRLRRLAAWVFVATMIIGIAWAVLSWR